MLSAAPWKSDEATPVDFTKLTVPEREARYRALAKLRRNHLVLVSSGSEGRGYWRSSYGEAVVGAVGAEALKSGGRIRWDVAYESMLAKGRAWYEATLKRDPFEQRNPSGMVSALERMLMLQRRLPKPSDRKAWGQGGNLGEIAERRRLLEIAALPEHVLVGLIRTDVDQDGDTEPAPKFWELHEMRRKGGDSYHTAVTRIKSLIAKAHGFEALAHWSRLNEELLEAGAKRNARKRLVKGMRLRKFLETHPTPSGGSSGRERRLYEKAKSKPKALWSRD